MKILSFSLMMSLTLTLLTIGIITTTIQNQVFASNNNEDVEKANKAFHKALKKAEEGKQDQAGKAAHKAGKKCGGGFIIVPGSGGQDITCSG